MPAIAYEPNFCETCCMSNPAVIFGCSLLKSMVGRSSFRLGVRASTVFADPLRVLRTGGRPSYPIFLERRKAEVRLRRTPMPQRLMNKSLKLDGLLLKTLRPRSGAARSGRSRAPENAAHFCDSP